MSELVKLEMTPKERLTAYARGEEVDRIPTTLSAGETGCLEMLNIPICDYYFSADVMVEIESFLADRTGADNLGMGLGLRTLPEALGSVMVYPRESVSYVDVLRNGTHDEIAASVRDCILQAADNPKGFTLCPGCTTPVNTSLDNMIAFMNAAATYGRGARKGALPRGVEE